MNDKELLAQAIEVCRLLFLRNKTSGSSANMSFLNEAGELYVTASGTCFGTLVPEDFSKLSPDGELISGRKPSKELPAHLLLYRHCPDVKAVIHTHGRDAVLWSFTEGLDPNDCIPPHTPYLAMKVGNVGLVDYFKPGSKELFEDVEKRLKECRSSALLLKQHGAFVGGKSIMDAFYNLEELEESCAVAWALSRRS